MEAETIDLTDPLDTLLRQTGWTPEYLQERLLRMTDENSKKADKNPKEIRDLTLNDLLGDFKCSNRKASENVEVAETIELSDDEASDATDNITSKDDSDIQEVTEVKVIEVHDDDDYSSELHEDDDDDEFLEESTADIFHSNHENFYRNHSKAEEHIDNNLSLNTESIHISVEKNAKETCTSTSETGETPSLENNFLINSNNKTKLTKCSMFTEDNLSFNYDKQPIQDGASNFIKGIRPNNKENQESSNNTKKINEISLNLELDKSIHSNISKNHNGSNSVHRGKTLVETSTEINNGATEETSTHYEDKAEKNVDNSMTQEFDTLTMPKNDVVSDKMLNLTIVENNREEAIRLNIDCDSSLETSEQLLDLNQSENNMTTETINKTSHKSGNDLKNNKCIEGTIYIRKSIDEIIEQLDMACREDCSLKNDSKQVANTSNVERNSLEPDVLFDLPLGDDSKSRSFSQTLQIDSSTRLLLKNLDEAIETCDKNNDFSRRDVVLKNLGFPNSDSNTVGLSNVEDVPCKHQTNLDNKLDKNDLIIPAMAGPPKSNQNLTENCNFLRTQACSDIHKDNCESTKITKHISSDNVLENLPCKHQTEKDEVKDNALLSTEDAIDSYNLKISKDYQVIIEDYLEPATKTNNNSNNDSSTDYLKTSIYNKIEINDKSTTAIGEKIKTNIVNSEKSTDYLCLVVRNSSDQNYKHASPIVSFESVNETYPATSDTEIKAKSKSDKFGNNSDVNLEVLNQDPNIKDNIVSPKQVTSDDSSGNVNFDNKTCTLSNITKKHTFTKSQSYLDNNETLIQQINVEGKLLEKNTQLSKSPVGKNCKNTESEKVITKTCRLESPSINVHDKNADLIETEDTDKNLKGNVTNYFENDNIVEESSPENFDEIRKNLKLQLRSLRTKKKIDILQDVKTKFINNDTCQSSLLSDNILQDPNLIKPLENVKKLSSNESVQKLSENLQPVKQDLLPVVNYLAEPSKSDSVLEKPEDEDVPNVFNEIRKIIRKQKTTPKVSMLKSVYNSEGTEIKSKAYDIEENEKRGYQIRNEKQTEVLNTTIEDDKEMQTVTSNNLEDKNRLPSNVVNSPFVSNSLDEFLTDAKLNVSYTIPKSGAEEGLRQNYADEPIMPPVITEIKDEDSEKPVQEIKYKPKTLAEKRRFLEKNKLKERKRLEKLKKLEEGQKRSYVLYKDKKIFLKAKLMGKCIASIESSVSVPENVSEKHTTPRKPSLLTELYKKATTPVKYRPGPLCKKHLLQTDYSNWTTELQDLPKVTLEIMPQLGKPIHPNLLHILPQWDGEVTNDQIEFAVSALVTKESLSNPEQGQILKFNVPYKNQQTQILTRKRILDKPTLKLEHLATKKEHFSASEEDVAQVIEKLLTYVEIKEIAPTLLKYDKDVNTFDESPLETEVLPLSNHVLVKRKSRFTKTDRELLRLNCKVVSVEVEENEPETQCFKPYCRLGCICKSLQCERIIGLHCQKSKCIFGCSCPKEKDKIISIAEPTIKLPAGTDLLSMDTVTRIEGEAKRNLAKVEKEFTQTVILTNDKTIVVGFGNKPRRATKTPKKYTDFFDDEIVKGENQESKKEEAVSIRECSVVLENWDFSDIIPYCLVHHLYQCHCRGHSTYPNNIQFRSYKKEIDKLLKLKKEETLISAENKPILLSDNNCAKRTVEESFKAIVRESSTFDRNLNPDENFEETLYSVTGRPLRKRKKIYKADFVFEAGDSLARKVSETEKCSSDKTQVSSACEPDYCSRTRAISHKYYQKVWPFFKAALYDDFVNNLTQADLLKASQHKNDNNISDIDHLKRTIIEERKKLLEETESEIHKKKRKQKIQIRKDDNITINTTGKILPLPKRVRKGKVKSVFKGEIIVNDSEWLKKLGQNAKQPLDGYARILPWTALLNGFLSKSVNVYCISDMPLRLLLNAGSKLTGEKILDVEKFGHKILAAPLKAKASWLISQSENVREIIKWLLSGTLPSRYKKTCLSFLLVETLPDQFEVRGLCTQGENKQEGENTPDVTRNSTDLFDDGELSDQVTEVKHKNLNNEIESLFISKGKYRLRELVEDGCDDDLTDNLYMWVGLPEVYKVAKWRVVFLNNDFAFLYFKNIKYSIKYTDLVKLTEMAKEEMLTLVLKNVQIRRNYEHNSFGIYISHHYKDRIFIGPYFINYDEDEVETLRYINQQLVSTESFNKMTGNPNYRCGHWMYERLYYHTPTVYMKDTIDLTNDDAPPNAAISVLKDNSSNSSVSLPSVLLPSVSVPSTTNATTSISTPQPLPNAFKDEHIIYHNGMSIHIKNSKPRSPSEFNRFIITNIPHFGYLGAYQPDNSSTLEVSWPFEKKVLQFENADNARDFLQERFNQLLQPVPETFKIQVIVLIHLDLKEHQPINSDFLSGHCVCGYFGTYNFRELSDEFCKQKLNTSKEEITKLFAKRAHAYIRKKIEELAEIVGVHQNDPVNFTVPTILNKAKEEIRSQENIRKQHVSEIQSYELKVIAKMKKLYEMINNLPRREQNIESKILNEILQIRPKRLGANEIVEIKDDDDDSESTKTKSDPVIYVVCGEGNSSIQPTKQSLKRKKTYENKARNPKVAKVAPFTSGSNVKPSVSVLKLQTDTVLKPATNTKNINTKNKGKKSILIVRPHQTGIPTLLENTDRDSVQINENTETIIINEDIEEVTGNEDIGSVPSNKDIETVAVNEDVDTVISYEDLETVTITEDMETEPIYGDLGTLKNNETIETITINEELEAETINEEILQNISNIETVTINEDMETVTINEIPEYKLENENCIDEENANHCIIEYEGSDPNLTEIIVSQPSTAENIDLSKATIIASVPPTSIISDSSVTVPVFTPEIPSSSSNTFKTYSKKSKPVIITPVPLEFKKKDLDTTKEIYTTESSSKELTSKIKLGLQKIIKKSQGNFRLLNQREKSSH